VTSEDLFLVDTSVLVAAAFGQSPAARQWLDQRLSGTLVGSKILELDYRRAVRDAELAGRLDPGVIDPGDYLSHIALGVLDDALADEAAAIPHPLRGADALQVATALRLGTTEVAVATHDRQMAAAARGLGFRVVDPVTDDPQSPAV
jgi:predicted nucleic acid-binding protein